LTKPSANEKIKLDDVQVALREVLSCIKTLSLYPPNHPAQGPALLRAFRRLEGILVDSGPISFGVSDNEVILIGKDDKEYRIVTELAQRIHQFGILTVNFETGLNMDEVGVFLRHLARPDDSEDQKKRIDQILQESGSKKIALTFVNYRKIIEQDPTTPSTSEASDVWTALIQRAHGGDKEALKSMSESLSNSSQFHGLSNHIKEYISTLTLDDSTNDPAMILSEIHQKAFESLSPSEQEEFSRNLACMALSDDSESSGSGNELVRSFLFHPDEMLLKVMASAVAQQGKIDSRITTTFKMLLQNKERREALGSLAEQKTKEKASTGYSPEVWGHILNLCLAVSEEQYMSEDYHQVLQELSTYHLDELREAIGGDYLLEVQASLRPEVLKQIRSEMVYDLILEENQEDLLDRHPLELNSLLADYAQRLDMVRILEALKRLFSPDVPMSPSKRERLEEIIFRPQGHSWSVLLVQEIGKMGKEEFDLLKEILNYNSNGLPEVLIRQLGEEGSISGRKRLSNLLISMESRAIPAIVDFLEDDRWFLVRNLVMILGKIGKSSCIESLLPLLTHGHFRVQKEVLLTLSLIGGDQAVVQIRRILLNRGKKTEPGLRVAAGQALKRIGTAKSRKVLQEGLEDKDKKVQEVCCQVLKGLI
jgi:hypothetical protein